MANRDTDPLTPVEAELRRRAIRKWIVIGSALLLLFLVASWLCSRYLGEEPVTYDDAEQHFKYGSIGSDIENGLPQHILAVMPRMFPEYLPEGAPPDLTAFGFIQEDGQPLPIGFSQRRKVIDLAGLNCALCHAGQVRATPESEPVTILGMPSNTVDLSPFFDFIVAAAKDYRFTPDNILAEVEKDLNLNFIDRIIYRQAVPALQAGLLTVGAQMDAFMFPDHPKFGPGRVETFNFYKVNQFADRYPPESIEDSERIGTVDFPSVWNQRPREGMNLHWDGNNASVRERNFSAAFGAGATPENVDAESFDRVTAWLQDLPAPVYPFEMTADDATLARGAAIYAERCAECHAFDGEYVGQVDPIGQIGTDRLRLDTYTEKLMQAQHDYGDGYDWDFTFFKKTDGYANHPLDGIWARAPYLHNGSVPTLYDLLLPEDQRNGGESFFYRGHGVYDTEDVGIRTDVTEIDGRAMFRFDLTLPGNANKGHTGPRYGTDLEEPDRRALVEYMKTL